ncbi:MAG TPA: hypothetical protein VLD59_13470 [Steroidobacteraceae bacterium]|nr:hypothetical protein [Steroidobacteraceae bacterium]
MQNADGLDHRSGTPVPRTLRKYQWRRLIVLALRNGGSVVQDATTTVRDQGGALVCEITDPIALLRAGSRGEDGEP